MIVKDPYEKGSCATCFNCYTKKEFFVNDEETAMVTYDHCHACGGARCEDILKCCQFFPTAAMLTEDTK